MNNHSSSSSPTSSPTFYDAVFPKSRGGASPSFSSSSSSSAASSFRDDDIITPSGGVPFSWEKQPGIPKKPLSSLKIGNGGGSPVKILPLPPPITPRSSDVEEARRARRSNVGLSSSSRFVPRDPFFAAFVECSKGGGGGGGGDGEGYDREFFGGQKVTRSISDRFGLVGMSCKRTCAVSESLVYLPTRLSTSSPARPPYDLVSRRR
ncbi:hypothetical protein LINPERHAP2_LOCUS32080 [Linum perenne]